LHATSVAASEAGREWTRCFGYRASRIRWSRPSAWTTAAGPKVAELAYHDVNSVVVLVAHYGGSVFDLYNTT